MEKAMIVKVRKDRLGAIFNSMLGEFIYIKSLNFIPIYPKSFNHSSIFFKTLKNFMKENDNKYDIIQKKKYGIRENQMLPTTKIKQDLVSYFRENYLNDFNNEINKYTLNYKLPWDNNKNIICIHIRLDDVTNRKDYDGTGSANYINKLINDNNPLKYDRSKMMKCSPDHQVPICPTKLKNLLLKLKKKYPNKKINIVKFGNLNNEYKKLIKDYNITVHQNDPDYDLWLLINCDILVLSKSTFSQIAVYFHKGSEIYSPLWGTGVSNGIMSKYNKTNIKFYN